MNTTTEKQATGYEMSHFAVDYGDRWGVSVYQNGRLVFACDGCESRQHAEQIARDICVRYALTERPTV